MVMFTTMLLLPTTGLAQQNTTVTGTVLYRERIALPATAQVNVQLQDVSRADAAATILAEQTLDTAGKGPPYAFTLTYDPAQIRENGTYVVRATIRVGDQLLFTTTDQSRVITQGHPPSNIELLVRRAGGAQPRTDPAPGASTGSGGNTPTTLPGTGGIDGAGTLCLVLAALLFGAGLFARRSKI